MTRLNKVAEHLNRTIMDKVRVMLIAASHQVVKGKTFILWSSNTRLNLPLATLWF
jgi:hypothetical protein